MSNKVVTNKPWWKFGAEEPEQEDDVVLPPSAPAAETKKDDAKPEPTHPVLVAALSAGLDTKEKFEEILSTAKQARTDLQASCLKEAVRCFGADKGPAKAKALEGQSYADASAMRDLWKETADAKFNVTDDSGAKPKTAPVPRAEDNPENRAPGAKDAGTPVLDIAKIYETRKAQGG